MKSGEPFGFAGVWDVWNGPQGKVFSCAIITMTPNQLTSQVHDRMPVILARDDEAAWLDPTVTDPTKLTAMLRPYPAEAMKGTQVNPALNRPTFERPECLMPG